MRHFRVSGLGTFLLATVFGLAAGCGAETTRERGPVGSSSGGSGGGTTSGTTTGGSPGTAPQTGGSTGSPSGQAGSTGSTGGSTGQRDGGTAPDAPRVTMDGPGAPVIPDAGSPSDYVPGPPPFLDAGAGPPSVAVIALTYTGELPSPGATTKLPGTIAIYPGPLANSNSSSLMTMTASFQGPMLVGGRGNSSWGSYPMKSKEFELQDMATMMEKEIAILGMPPGSDFAMWACYADVTCLHNWFTFDLGRRMGRWAPRTHFAEVFINGSYDGLYLVQEKIRRDKYRVNVPKPAMDMATGDITGGYILKFDSSSGTGSQFQSRMGQAWNYHYPRFREVTTAQKAYLKTYIDQFEATFFGATFSDPVMGFKAKIDIPSWVDTVIIQELANNGDAYWRSQYLHKESDANGGKMYLGPLWDFDLAWGVANLRGSYMTSGFSYVNGAAMVTSANGGTFPAIFTRLWMDPEFQKAVRCRWKELRAGVLKTETLQARIDEGAMGVNAAIARHQAKWRTLGAGIPPLQQPSRFTTYASAITHFKTWVRDRAAWLDTNLPGACP